MHKALWREREYSSYAEEKLWFPSSPALSLSPTSMFQTNKEAMRLWLSKLWCRLFHTCYEIQISQLTFWLETKYSADVVSDFFYSQGLPLYLVNLYHTWICCQTVNFLLFSSGTSEAKVCRYFKTRGFEKFNHYVLKDEFLNLKTNFLQLYLGNQEFNAHSQWKKIVPS